MDDAVTDADASVEPGFTPWKEDVGEVEANPTEPEQEETELQSEAESSPAVEDNDEEKTQKAEEAEPKDDKNGVQKRIDDLTRQWRTEQREREALEKEIQELRAKRAESEEIKTLADFEYDDAKYQRYLFSEATKRAEAAAERKLKNHDTEVSEQRARQEFAKREQAFTKEVKDYQQVVYREDLRVTDAMKAEIMDSELGPEIAYYLGKNPDVADRIASLPERQSIREMVKLESRIEGEKRKAAAKKVSEAPPPPSKIKATESSQKIDPTSPDSDKLSDKEWFEKEEARLAKLRSN